VHDAELVRRFKAGDEVAFVEIVTRFRGRMHSIALSHLRNHADAVEITQKLGISIGTVKSRLGRACEKLRILLAEPYTELAPDASPPAWFEPVQACGRALVVAARAHATRRPRSNDF
jgi:DNA-directed RNA polymerase specialized sigma24 family protein